MKRLIIAIAVLAMSFASASAQRLGNIAVEAQYITDKMAVELGLDSRQRNSILQLNINYLSGITSYRDISSKIWKQRNNSLKALLNSAQWNLYKNATYFYCPIGWKNGSYVHYIYDKYPKRDCRPTCPKPPKRYDRPGQQKGPKYDKQRGNKKGNKKGNRQESFGSRR